jgi:alpha-ribazole phosphatase
MEVYLIRHTRVAVADGLCYGLLDVPLADSFEEEARELRAWLPAFDQIYSSPAGRCRRLAQHLGEDNVVFDDHLLELDFGAWEGRTWDDIDSPEARSWGNCFVDSACPDGESYKQLAARVTRWREGLQETAERIAVITHAALSGPCWLAG